MLGGTAEAELRQLGFAQRDQPGALHHSDHFAVGLRRKRFPRVGAAHRRLPGDVNVVLDEGRHAVKKPGPRRRVARRLAARHVVTPVSQTIEFGVDGFGAGYGGLDDLDRAQPARPDSLGQRDGIEVTEGIVTKCVYAEHGLTLTRPAGQDCPTSNRTNRVTVTPASSSRALTVFLLSDTDGCSSSTVSLKKPFTRPSTILGSACSGLPSALAVSSAMRRSLATTSSGTSSRDR